MRCNHARSFYINILLFNFFYYSYLETKNHVDFIKSIESTLNIDDIITTYRKINALKIILVFLTYNLSTFCLKLKIYNKRHVIIFKIKTISYLVIIFLSFKIIHIKIATSFITDFSPVYNLLKMRAN